MKAEEIEKRQVNRFIILLELYKIPVAHTANAMSVAYEKGIKNGFFDEAYEYLKEEGLILGAANKAKITHAGRKAVERTIKNPEIDTELFPPYKDMGI